MSGLNSDQLHRSTLGIYSSLMDEFNPGLQKLVSLGKSYMQAFQAFADTSEAYFTALSKIGENALNTTSSRSLDVLIQISETQRRLTVELGGVFRRFDTEVIQSMNNNIRLDRDYMTTSRRQYEMEVQNLTRYMRRGVNQDYNEYMQFLQRSHDEALKEQERRQRFLAEKHCGLMQSFAQLMNKTGGLLQQRTDMWTQDVNAHRGVEARRPSSVASFEDTSKFREEPILGSIPSRVPSPLGNSSRSSFDSAGGGGSSGGRTMRALVAHQPGASNKTLLAFSKGETITVLVQQSRNGWLYGRTDSSSRPGWFPSTYVKAVDDPPSAISHRNPLRNDSSNNLSSSDQPRGRNLSGSAPPPVPPPLSGLPSERRSEMQPAPSNSEQKRSKPQDSRPELFPRGTNPFATVKLKPTQTNDRSAPRLYR
ncbi:uncharacterized protein V6R79_008832 [Siganus canaliculatus]